MLVWATTFGAALGPTIALDQAADIAQYMGLPELSGPYLLGMILFAIGLTVTHTWLRPDPLEVLGTIGEAAARPASLRVVGRRIAASPAARLAVIAMLISAFPVAQRVEMQGGADLLMTGGGAIAGLSSGVIMEHFGFHSLSHYAGLAALLLVAAAAAAWYNARQERSEPVPTG